MRRGEDLAIFDDHGPDFWMRAPIFCFALSSFREGHLQEVSIIACRAIRRGFGLEIDSGVIDEGDFGVIEERSAMDGPPSVRICLAKCSLVFIELDLTNKIAGKGDLSQVGGTGE